MKMKNNKTLVLCVHEKKYKQERYNLTSVFFSESEIMARLFEVVQCLLA